MSLIQYIILFQRSQIGGHVHQMCRNVPTSVPHFQNISVVVGNHLLAFCGITYHCVKILYNVSCNFVLNDHLWARIQAFSHSSALILIPSSCSHFSLCLLLSLFGGWFNQEYARELVFRTWDPWKHMDSKAVMGRQYEALCFLFCKKSFNCMWNQKPGNHSPNSS